VPSIGNRLCDVGRVEASAAATESARRHAFGLRRLSSSNVAMLSARGTPMRVSENKWRDEIRGHYAIGKTAAIPSSGDRPSDHLYLDARNDNAGLDLWHD
jgi:hypothetical protein